MPSLKPSVAASPIMIPNGIARTKNTPVMRSTTVMIAVNTHLRILKIVFIIISPLFSD